MPLLGWWLTGLFDMDEGFYGAVVSEMNRRGEWITPYYNGHPWFEKPILLYWLAKPSMLAFGDWVGPRLPSVLATFALYGLIAWFARRRWDDQTARWCVLVAASCVLVAGLGRLMMTDAVLNLCLAGGFLFFWESLVGNRRWRWLSGACLGVSVLAKGPVGVILFLPVLGWTYWRERELRPSFRSGWGMGTLLFVAAVAAWYVPAYLANGHEFVQKFLIEQNLNRFTGGDQAHTLPFLQGLPFYVVVLFIGMCPWSLYLWKAWRGSSGNGSTPLTRFLWIWAIVPFVFFTISKAKLPHYILPIFVPLAILVGAQLSQMAARETPLIRRLRFPLVTTVVVAVAMNVAFFAYYNWFHREVHQLALYVRGHVQQGEDVAAYQMPRRQSDLGTGKPEIQETSHPSLVMYLARPVLEPDNLSALLEDPKAVWVLTREDRISASDMQSARAEGRDLRIVDTPVKQDHYRLYYLTPNPGSRTRR